MRRLWADRHMYLTPRYLCRTGARRKSRVDNVTTKQDEHSYHEVGLGSLRPSDGQNPRATLPARRQTGVEGSLAGVLVDYGPRATLPVRWHCCRGW